jgi:hypothetical protein
MACLASPQTAPIFPFSLLESAIRGEVQQVGQGAATALAAPAASSLGFFPGILIRGSLVLVYFHKSSKDKKINQKGN